MEKNESSIFNAAFHVFIAQFFSAVLAFGINILIARGLGPHGQGQYSLLTSITSILSTVLIFGLGPAIVILINSKKYSEETLLRGTLVIDIIGLIIGFIIIYIIKISNFQKYSSSLDNNYILFAVAIAFTAQLIWASLLSFLTAKLNFKSFLLVSITRQISMLSFLLIIIQYLTITYSLIIFSCSFLFASFIVIERLNLKIGGRKGSIFKVIKRIFSIGWKPTIGTALISILFSLDIFIATYFFSYTQVGIYAIGLIIANKIWLVQGGVHIVLLPHSGKIKNAKRNRILLKKASRYSLIIMIPVSIIAIIVMYWGFPILYGNEFKESYYPFTILIISALFYAIIKNISAILMGMGYMEITLLQSIPAIVFKIFFSITFIPVLGILGISIASLIGSILTLYICGSYARIKIKITFFEMLFFNSSDIINVYNLIKKRIIPLKIKE